MGLRQLENAAKKLAISLDQESVVARAASADLAAFCDARLPEQHDAYRNKLRADLNEVAQTVR